MNTRIFCATLVAILSPPAVSFAAVSGNAWGANTGWVPAHDSAALTTTSGGNRVLSGFLHSANCGWINLGNGTPGDGATYSNASGADSGVNHLPDGALRGLAWSANLGWIQFEPTGNPRLDAATGLFSGHAWSANTGWIALAGLAVSIQPPIAGADAFSRAEGSGLKLRPAQLLANDTDALGAALTVVSVESPTPAGATVSLAEGWIFYTPPPGYIGKGSFKYTISNPGLATASGSVVIPMASRPDLPTPNRVSLTVLPGGAVALVYAGIPGRTYTFQAAENLNDPVIWQSLGTAAANPLGEILWTDLDAPVYPTRFYRTDAPANP